MVKGALFKKSIQDMKKNRSQFLSIFIMAVLAIGMSVGLDTIWTTVYEHSQSFYKATDLSDFWISASNPSELNLWRVRNIKGVQKAEKRFSINNATAEIDGKPSLQIYAVPSENTLDMAEVMTGKRVSKRGAILDRSFAEANRLSVGDSLTVKVNDHKIVVMIEALALTSLDVAQAQDALNTLDCSITNLQNQSKAIDTEMNILLGHSYNDTIVFGNVPNPDTDYTNKIDLDSDLTAAQDASYNIKIKRKQRAVLSDETYKEKDKKNALNDDMELELQNIGSSLDKQYKTIQEKKVVLTAKQQKLATAEFSQEQALKKHEAGILSTMDYAKIRYNTLSQQYSVKAAMLGLSQEIESYKWIMRGLPASN